MKSPLASVLAFSLVLAVAGSACSSPDRAIWTNENSPKMIEAEKAAQASLPVFWKRVDSGDPGVGSPMVKVGYPTAHGGMEYLWMEVDSHSDESVSGRIANAPEDVPDVHDGDQVVVDISRVVDWAYVRGDRYFGQFTTRVLIEEADAETRRDAGAELLAPTPIEPESN